MIPAALRQQLPMPPVFWQQRSRRRRLAEQRFWKTRRRRRGCQSDSLEFGAYPEYVPWARQHARSVLAGWGLGELADDTETVVSELASNAVIATRADEAAGLPGGEPAVIVLVLGWRARGIRIEMWDRAPGSPQMREPDWAAEGGRGLFLVDQLTGGRWGCRKTGTAKCVWAELG